MNNKLTNVRTYLQFSKGHKVFSIVFNGNKLMAMNRIKSAYGISSLSVLREFKADEFLIEGQYSELPYPL